MNEEAYAVLYTSLAAAFAPAMRSIIDVLGPILHNMYDTFSKAICEIGDWFAVYFEDLIVVYALASGVPPKWVYIYQHTKKYRTRKKYYKLLLAAAAAYLEGN